MFRDLGQRLRQRQLTRSADSETHHATITTPTGRGFSSSVGKRCNNLFLLRLRGETLGEHNLLWRRLSRASRLANLGLGLCC